MTGSVPPWVLGALQPFLESQIGENWESCIGEWHFQSRYFSSLIAFRIEGPSSGRFLAKFPKAVRGRGFSQVPTRLDVDLELAKQEYSALQALAKHWPHGETSYVQPRFYDRATGMLVFDYLDGCNLYSRSLPLRLALGSIPTALLNSMRTLGHALAAYHTTTRTSGHFDFSRLSVKVQARAEMLGLPSAKWVP